MKRMEDLDVLDNSHLDFQISVNDDKDKLVTLQALFSACCDISNNKKPTRKAGVAKRSSRIA